MSPLRIAIVGGGPAGSLLAILLSKESIDVTIFEGEADANARTQGGSLDLHTKTGLAALKRAGLYDEFLKYARFDGEVSTSSHYRRTCMLTGKALMVTNNRLKPYISMGGNTTSNSRGRPEIDRKSLRDILLAALPAGVMRWNHKLLRVDNDLTMHFDCGTETSRYDLIVGAEGTWSKIRTLLTPVKPSHSGVGGVRLGIKDVAESHPDVYQFVNRGSVFAFADSKSLMAQQLGDGSLTVSTYSIVKEDWMKDLDYDLTDLSSVKNALLEQYAGWAPELRQLIEASDLEPWVANMYELPVGHCWDNRTGITLLGDAAHVMTPFAGEGVNLAMEDAMHLADAITKSSKVNLDKNIKAYEENMFVRATKTQQMTCGMKQAIFFSHRADGDVDIEKWIITAAGHDMPWFLLLPFNVAVYAYFWYFRLRYG